MGRKVVGILILSILLIIVGCAKKPTKTAQGYWDAAADLFQKQEFEKCNSLYQEMVKFYPQDTLTVKALFAMADISKNNMNDLDNAISIYERITRDYPESEKTPNAKFMIGYTYANDLNDYEKARKNYNEFLEQHPNHVLVQSAKWELENLGKSIDEIPQLESITKKQQ